MISQYVTHIGFLIRNRTPAEAYDILRARGYLSAAALDDRDGVLSLLQRLADAYPEGPMVGQELWRDMDHSLEEAGYLSATGLTEGRRLFTRDGREAPQ